MIKKNYLTVGAVALVAILGAGWYVFAGGDSAKYSITNFYGNISENSTPPEAGPVGATEFNTGKVTFNQLADGVLQEKIVVVASSSIATIAKTPVLLLANPGSNRVNQISSIIGFRVFSSESWSYGKETAPQQKEGLEVKWGPAGVSAFASGMNGQAILGGSFSTGFLTGGTNNAGNSVFSSPSIEFWIPSGFASASNRGANTLPTGAIASASSAVYLTASTSFANVAGTANDTDTSFIFRVIYRILRLPQNP